MLSSVLQSPQAVQVNIAVMRAFVRLRETLSLHKELAHKLSELERPIESLQVTKDDLWDARIDTSEDPPLLKMDLRNRTWSGSASRVPIWS